MRLRGFNCGIYDVAHNEQAIRRAHELGANFIRYAFYTPEENNLTISQWYEWLDRQMETFNQTYSRVLDLDIRFNLSLHSTPLGRPTTWFGHGPKPRYVRKLRGMYSRVLYDKECQDALIQGWRKLAARYSGAENVVMYDLMNEPLGAFKRWRKLAQRLVHEIRQIDAHTTLSISTPRGSVSRITKFKKPLEGSGLIYTAHFYEPGEITHHGVPARPRGEPYPGRFRKRDLRRHLLTLDKWSKQHNRKIYIGEVGATRFYPNNQYAYLKDALDLIQEFGWDCTIHALRECSAFDPDSPNAPMQHSFCEVVPYSHTNVSQMIKERFESW